MKYTLEVTYTGIPSNQFVYDIFRLTIHLFSDDFIIEFVRTYGDRSVFEIKTSQIRDFYVAGMVGSKIEELLTQ